MYVSERRACIFKKYNLWEKRHSHCWPEVKMKQQRRSLFINAQKKKKVRKMKLPLPLEETPEFSSQLDGLLSRLGSKALHGALWWPATQDDVKQLQLTFCLLKSSARCKLFPENYNLYIWRFIYLFFLLQITRGETILRTPWAAKARFYWNLIISQADLDYLEIIGYWSHFITQSEGAMMNYNTEQYSKMF